MEYDARPGTRASECRRVEGMGPAVPLRRALDLSPRDLMRWVGLGARHRPTRGAFCPCGRPPWRDDSRTVSSLQSKTAHVFGGLATPARTPANAVHQWLRVLLVRSSAG